MCEGAKDGVPDMATLSAQFEPVAWWWTRNQIGRDLKELYEVSKELPPKLLELVRKLDTVESNQSGSRTLVSKLDVIEGKYLSRFAPPIEPRSVGPSDDWFLCTWGAARKGLRLLSWQSPLRRRTARWSASGSLAP
jgi:hypothetical protein